MQQGNEPDHKSPGRYWGGSGSIQDHTVHKTGCRHFVDARTQRVDEIGEETVQVR